MRYDTEANPEEMGMLLRHLSRRRWEDRDWHEEAARRAWRTPLEPLDPRVFSQDVPGGHRFFDVGWPDGNQFGGVTFESSADMLIHEAASYRFISPLGPPLYLLSAGDAIAMTLYGRLWPENSRFDAPETHPSCYTGLDHVELAVGPPPDEFLPPLCRISLDYVLRQGCGVKEPRVMTVRPNLPDLIPDLTVNVFGNTFRTEQDLNFVREALALCLPRHLQPRLQLFAENIFPADRWEPLKR